MEKHLRRFVRIVLWGSAAVLVAIIAVVARGLFYNPPSPAQDISFAQLLNEIDQGEVRTVLIEGTKIQGAFTNGRSFATYMPTDPSLIQRLCNNAKIIEIKGGCGTIQ